MCPNLHKIFQIGLKLFKVSHVEIAVNLTKHSTSLKLVLTCPNWFKLVQTGLNMSTTMLFCMEESTCLPPQMVICSNWFKPVQIGQNLFKVKDVQIACLKWMKLV